VTAIGSILDEAPARDMDPNAVFAILLLIAGIGILTAEVFVPSGGLLGIITFLMLVVSLIFAYRAWGSSHPNIFWAFFAVLLFLVPTTLGTAFYVLPRTALGKRVLLEAPTAEQVTPFARETDHLQQLVGKFGKAVSPLTPGGLVVVNGERLHAFSEGMIVQSGQSIEVLEVCGSRLRVRPATPSESPSDIAKGGSEPSSPLDFEFPQS
jgi:membrane-bound ClpP family serine protease